MFRYYSCSFRIPLSKQTTSRAVMQQKLGISNVYTIESSVDSFFDRDKRSRVIFKAPLW